tara:strand:+ start:428 stop:565 length:138 start_codon:yes stop_codon:yes gene_type:complete
MRKLIDIKDELVVPLKILAAKENKPLKNFIEDIVESKVKLNKPHN